MRLALFDLDDTLLAGSCDFIWENYLLKQGLLNKDTVEQSRVYFTKKYQDGSFDVFERQKHFLTQLSFFSIIELNQLLSAFIQQEIPQFIYKSAFNLIRYHQKQQDCLLIISAASSFLVKPIAKLLSINTVIATEPEIIENSFTGEIMGLPCFGTYKALHFKNWLNLNKYNFKQSYFYSDSIHDLALFKLVTHPVATNPDTHLQNKARMYNWKIINLKEKNSNFS